MTARTGNDEEQEQATTKCKNRQRRRAGTGNGEEQEQTTTKSRNRQRRRARTDNDEMRGSLHYGGKVRRLRSG
jgi:hypothetical protein